MSADHLPRILLGVHVIHNSQKEGSRQQHVFLQKLQAATTTTIFTRRKYQTIVHTVSHCVHMNQHRHMARLADDATGLLATVGRLVGY